MCGIWCYFNASSCENTSELFKSFMKIKNRGPDKSIFISKECMCLGFHRLAIMDLSVNGDQPFTYSFIEGDLLKTVYVMCNGEIYNYKELRKRYEEEFKNIYTLKSTSDCEIIMPYFLKYGIETTSKLLEGEYAFTCIVMTTDKSGETEYEVYICRDRFGIRPLFYSYDRKSLMFCSEMKGLIDIPKRNKILVFPPRTWMKFSFVKSNVILEEENTYYSLIKENEKIDTFDLYERIRNSLIKAVKSRLQSDREVGCLLSGGLDSSLISAIAAKILAENGLTLHTFSIGMPESTDAVYAKMVSDYIGSNHTNIVIPEEEWLEALEKVIEITETYDITTIRATTGQFLISKWISKNTNIKVLLIGDGSDELTSGYLYFHNSPSSEDSQQENIKLLENIHYFDVLRADRGISSNGLEARVPFLEKDFVDLYLSIDKDLRVPRIEEGVMYEKYLLRKAFDTTNILPRKVLWRRKEAFSDGVSSIQRSWFTIIQERIEKNISDEYFKNACDDDQYGVKPQTKEGLYYKMLFKKYYQEEYQILPYYWMPNWVGYTNDPSARTLENYQIE